MHIFNKTYRIGELSLLTVGISLLLLAVSVALAPRQAHAQLSGSQFQAGRIIDNGIFYNQHSMSTAQIQQFLNARVPVCDTNGTKPYGGTTRAAYGTSRGVPPPYICLKDYTQNVPAVTNGGSDLCTGSMTGGTKTAARIIYDVSIACGINPQVMIVLLQKEQSLVTDDWPWPIQYRSATGYGCPDTAPCDAEFYGYFNQVYQAARAFKRYAANPHNYNYRAGRNNFIYYHPSLGACGGTNVFIQNQATANLYIYTPYQPNAAALNNLYGTGDGCSAYGNRNFWRMFNDWFGSTFAMSHEAQFVRQSAHPSMFPGGTSTGFIDYRNIGQHTWYDSSSAPSGQRPVNLATSNPVNRASIFGISWGGGKNRPATRFHRVYETNGTTLASDQTRVHPNQIVRFQFTFRAPNNQAPGQYREWFRPVLEGSNNWDMKGTAWLQATVVQPINGAQFHSQSAHPVVKQNERKSGFIKYLNTGNQNWYRAGSAPAGGNTLSLATTNTINRSSVFGATWGGGRNRPAVHFSVLEGDGKTHSINQDHVKPGQVARFGIIFTANSTQSSGKYREWFQPILEGAPNWNIGGQAWLEATVLPTSHSAAFAGQCPYPTIARGSSATCYLRYKNTGTNDWYSSNANPAGVRPVNLATSNPINRPSLFGSSWGGGKNRPSTRFAKVYESNGSTLASNQSLVKPGQIAEFEFTFTVPTNANLGAYQEWFQPLIEGAPNWNIGGQAWIRVTVN